MSGKQRRSQQLERKFFRMESRRAKRCKADGCLTLTLNDYCTQHQQDDTTNPEKTPDDR